MDKLVICVVFYAGFIMVALFKDIRGIALMGLGIFWAVSFFGIKNEH